MFVLAKNIKSIKPAKMKKILIITFILIAIKTQAQTVTYTYDNLYRLKTVTYHNGATITYNYDANGNRFSEVTTQATLPLKWFSFTATTNCITATLNWQTANEVNNKNFVVEQSINGVDFKSIATVEPNISNNYKYVALFTTHYSLLTTIYYRIKQIDNDGKFSYSSVEKIALKCNNKNISIYPNPVKDVLLIDGLSLPKNNIQIVNVLGKTVLQFSSSTLNSFNVSNLTKGVYMVKVNGEGGVKFVKE